MGVTLDLRLINHDRIAVRGLRAVNEAIRCNNPEILRDYLAGLPIHVDPDVVEARQARLARLREVNAPEIIIQDEERLLRQASGEAYRPKELKDATFDELRQLLGTWCWMSDSYSLDKSWNELHWFLEPAEGPEDSPLFPLRPRIGDPNATIFTQALQGAVHYPKDELGQPVIRTLGSEEADCSGYNPPPITAEIYRALQAVDPSRWGEHVPLRRALYRRACPDLDDDAIAGCVDDDLWSAREVFPVVVAAYSKAAAKGYGASCEYSM